MATFFTALGTAIASKLEDMQAFPLIINFLIMPLFFLSGALFPLEGLPRTIQIITYLDPLSYGVDGIRGALSSQLHFGFSHDFGIIIILVFLALGIGSWLFFV